MELVIGILRLTLQVCEVFGPYIGTAALGAYLEYKYGPKLSVEAANVIGELKAKLAAAEAKVKAAEAKL